MPGVLLSLKKATTPQLFSPHNEPFPTAPLRKEEEGSMVMFGGVNHSYYSGDLNWVPVSRPLYWQLTMDR